MFVNLLILIVVIAITMFLGRLTYRAIKAQRLWVKLSGGIGAGLLTLAFAAVSFMGAKGIILTYFPGAPDATDLKVAGTPEQVRRGEYLVNLSCVGCHGAVDSSGAPTGELPLSGGWDIAAAEGFGFMGSMVTENLTPGGKLADYSDGQIFRVLRHSVNKDGHKLGFMDFLPYKELSDQDTEAVIAYVRSLPPVESTVPTGDKMNFIGAVLSGSGMFPPTTFGAESVQAPPEGITPEYGKYVATYGECRGCHGPDMTGTPASSLGPAIPNPRPFVNAVTFEEFMQTMRTGVRPGGTPFSEAMPWQNAAKMTDDDLAALYLYLTTPPK